MSGLRQSVFVSVDFRGVLHIYNSDRRCSGLACILKGVSSTSTSARVSAEVARDEWGGV